VYSLKDYQQMFSHPERGPAFVDCVRAIVRPGDIVLDLGAGAGHLSVVAAQAGAAHVYAVETNPLVWMGAELAAANGCADRITWIQADSRFVELPERAHVLLADLRGLLPFGDVNLAVQNDARARLCHPDVRELTVRETLWAAPCEAPRDYRRAYREAGAQTLGVDCTPLLQRAAAMWYRAEVGAELLLADAKQWHTIKYTSNAPVDAAGRPSWTTDRAGTLDGLCVWFDAELATGRVLTNAPGTPETVYGRAFLPFVQPIAVAKGDRIEAELTFKALPSSYAGFWEAAVHPVAGSGRVPLRARLSTLDQLAFGPQALNSRALDYRPQRGVLGDAWQTLVALADGERTSKALAEELLRRHPLRFADRAAAEDFVTAAVAQLEAAASTIQGADRARQAP